MTIKIKSRIYAASAVKGLSQVIFRNNCILAPRMAVILPSQVRQTYHRICLYQINNLIAKGDCSLWYINPLSPHDALKHHFTSLKTYLIFLGVLEWIFPWNWFTNTWPFFLYFFIHIKSSSSTTSRELRQHFAAFGGWIWQCKVRF